MKIWKKLLGILILNAGIAALFSIADGASTTTDSAFPLSPLKNLTAEPPAKESAASLINTANQKFFTFRIRGEPETLDWNRAHTPIEATILMNLMEGLVTFDYNPGVQPALAESWKISPDGKTYTFKIRENVKWSDGVPLKAQDFVYSWKRLLSPLTAASYAYLLYDIEGAEDYHKRNFSDFEQVGVRAVDDHTLQVKLIHPVAHWIYLTGFWATFPMRQDVVEKYGEGWETPGRMVTLGPFMLAAHDHGSKVVLKANPSYYRDHGNLDGIVAQVIQDDGVAFSMYEAGKLDLLSDFALIDQKKLKGRKDLKRFPHLKTGYIGFLTTKYPWSNAKVRRAITMAIDRKKLVSMLQGGQEFATSFVPPTLIGHSKKIGLPFDPKAAKAELKVSGVNKFYSFSLEILIPNWDRSAVIGNFIKQQLKDNLGMEVTVQSFENKMFRTQLDLNVYPMFEGTWTADYPDPDSFLSIFVATSGNNRVNWKNDQFDQMVLAARQTKSSAIRENLYFSLQKKLIEDEAVIIPLYYDSSLVLMHNRVKNVDMDPLDFLFLRKAMVD